MIVTGPLIYLIGAIIWDGRLARFTRLAGFVIWVVVGIIFLRAGIGLVMLVLAVTVIPTLRGPETGVTSDGN